MSEVRLSKEDFDKLDELIGRHGFGGYYDLVECLKMVLMQVGKGKLKEDWYRRIKTLPEVVHLLMAVSGKDG